MAREAEIHPASTAWGGVAPGPGHSRDVPDVDLRIGDTSRLTGLSARALRYYEERGLIEVTRDARGRRLFGRVTRARLDLIVTLRRVGIPVHEIGFILRSTSRGREARLSALTIVEAHRAAAMNLVSSLDQLLEQLRSEQGQSRADTRNKAARTRRARAEVDAR